MTIVEVKVPQFPGSVEEDTLISWGKKPGGAVAQDEILIEIETNKVMLEVPAPSAGVLAEVLVADGATVTSEQLPAKIDTEGGAGTVAPTAAAPIPVTAAPAPAAAAPAVAAAGGVAMPSAAKLMTENSLSTNRVADMGHDGRITEGDVLGTAAGGAKPAAAAAPQATRPALQRMAALVDFAALSDRPEERVPMSRLRARIAKRLVQSQSANAILTTSDEVNMKSVMDLCAKFKDQFKKAHSVKLGFMLFFVKAAVHALKKYPIINVSVDGNDIIYRGYFDVGIVVGSPRGLVAPILYNADQMSLADIEKKVAEFNQRTKDGKLMLDDLTGDTFSISNGSTLGLMLSTPIINPPQSAILGIHTAENRAAMENGQVVIRPTNHLAMSYDHHTIDGREAMLGLVAMKEVLKDPTCLSLDL